MNTEEHICCRRKPSTRIFLKLLSTRRLLPSIPTNIFLRRLLSKVIHGQSNPALSSEGNTKRRLLLSPVVLWPQSYCNCDVMAKFCCVPAASLIPVLLTDTECNVQSRLLLHLILLLQIVVTLQNMHHNNKWPECTFCCTFTTYLCG